VGPGALNFHVFGTKRVSRQNQGLEAGQTGVFPRPLSCPVPPSLCPASFPYPRSVPFVPPVSRLVSRYERSPK
jgi:hypothetical protein